MKNIILSLLFVLLAAGLASSYEYHMPVNIEATLTPAVLLPGDEAILAIQMSNGAAAYGAGKDAGAGSSAAGTLLSTPINRTTLKSTADLLVLTEDSRDLGMIGPNDKITVYYKVKAANKISSGTHLLDFRVSGGYDMTTINREIPLKVDDTAVSMARAETDASNFNLNVANPRENTLNAVTIVPSAKGIVFSPDEYYIGTMDPDEVFTISFGIKSEDAAKPLKGPMNISFIAKFKNGDNWHTSQPYVTTYTPPKTADSQSSYLIPAGAAVLILLALGGYYYRRRKQNGKSNGDNSRSQKESRAF
ncbi:MAG: hypothetical protein A4E49_02765 [Methanosaeta sp. PtaU1.Bin112]|nr:MAG: hypothetical protein A4E49_02765 [Methanosaeta sp. PtaU1.Bin112]